MAVDNLIRECDSLLVGTALPRGQVIRELAGLVARREVPECLRMDNRSELVSRQFLDLCEATCQYPRPVLTVLLLGLLRVLSVRLRRAALLRSSFLPAAAEPRFGRFSTVAQSPIC